MFEGKRKDNQGGSNFALDDISVPIANCLGAPLVPPSPNSTAIGKLTHHEGMSMSTQRLFYFSFFPQRTRKT